MITPQNRKEFERHINMLYEGLEKGTHNIPNDKKLINSLLSTRKTPNKRMNFLTINETVRLMANSRATFDSPQFKNYINAEQ
jgi:hypothetical protein